MCAVGGRGSPGKYGTIREGDRRNWVTPGNRRAWSSCPGTRLVRREERKKERGRENIPGNVYVEYFGNGSRLTHCHLQKAVRWKIAIGRSIR